MRKLTRQDFHFDLPDHLIAHNPLDQRDSSRMLVRSTNGTLEDRLISNLPTSIPKNSLLIMNNTKVFPSRLIGRLETGGKVEIFLLAKNSNTSEWTALGRPFRKFKLGTSVLFPNGVSATITQINKDEHAPTVNLVFRCQTEPFEIWLERNGLIPLPPYIKRDDPKPAVLSRDRERYQTIYATNTGSVAAPTAGLHFTENLLSALSGEGIEIAHCCLHVGAGTFLPVKSDDLTKHKMHFERFSIPKKTLTAIANAKKQGRPVIAVGTTTFRSIESFWRKFGEVSADVIESEGEKWHETDLFIFPETEVASYKSAIFGGIVTNFHQPESTLLMLISALVGLVEVKKMYQHAIEQKYRFFSYGDCKLLWL